MNDLRIHNSELLEECIKGNQEALNMFYSRFASRMMGVITRYVSDTKDAEDILHDGFIVAFTNLHTVEHPENVEYWLATIMKNLSIKFLQNQDVLDVLDDVPEEDDTPGFYDILDFETLEKLINKLPRGYQNVFRLSVLENKTHKEISKILNIAPHSSSSQLFHAKMMMRRFIAEYRREAGLIVLLAILLCGGILYLEKLDRVDLEEEIGRQIIIAEVYDNQRKEPENTEMTGVIEKIDDVKETSEVADSQDRGTTIDVDDSNSGEPTAGTLIIGDNEATTDSVATSPAQEAQPKVNNNFAADNTSWRRNHAYAKYVKRSEESSGWSVGISAGIFLADNIAGKDFKNYASLDTEPGPKEDDESQTRSVSYDPVIKSGYHTDMPVTISLSLRKSLGNSLGIETALSYTYLHTDFNLESNKADASWHYLGIPLKLNINNYSSGRLNLYGAVGVQVDFPLKSDLNTAIPVRYPYLNGGKFHSPVSWAATASYGIGFNLSDEIGIFIEPSLQYRFNTSHDLPNAWTDNRWIFSLPIGVRFNL